MQPCIQAISPCQIPYHPNTHMALAVLAFIILESIALSLFAAVMLMFRYVLQIFISLAD